MSAHTPGPWKFTHPSNYGCGTYEHIESRGLKISQHLLGTTEPEIHANARLIAAAPDLLAALKIYLNAGNKDARRAASCAAKEAIAKAEGGQ